MDYIKIFNEIMEITHHDYAGWDEKRGWDRPEIFLEEMTRLDEKEELTPQKFVEIVSEYLISFQDRHMYFLLEGSESAKVSTCGFRVRRYEDALYITETVEEKRISKGAKIISIDNQSIAAIISSKQHLLRERSAEREDWSHIINKATSIKIVDLNNQVMELNLQKYEPVPRNNVSTLKSMNENTLLMTLPSFSNVRAVLDFVKNHEDELKACENLIIDVRKNNGGNGQAYSTLMQYIFPPEESPSTEVKLREFNCTKRNSDLFIQLSQAIRKNIDDEGTLRVLDFADEQFERFKGQGFIAFDFSDLIKKELVEMEGRISPRKIIVLSDSYCASAGEFFIETCMESSKVTVIGRSTMGVNDYSDLVMKNWDKMFTLYYPVSRLVEKTPNHPLHGKGIQPHHYIPWTPNHILEDVDLKYALTLIG
ncbi:MAG: S41 family peptidase [Heyndrickxia sp.]